MDDLTAEPAITFSTVEEIDEELRRLTEQYVNTTNDLTAAIDLERINELLERRQELDPHDC